MKTCKDCGQTKDLSEFHSHKSCSMGVRPECKDCSNIVAKVRSANYRKAEPIKRKFTVLKNKYGISQEQYEALLKEQDNKCKICGNPETGSKECLSIDHCHSTGKIRGLLCHLCNVGLGSFKDNIENIEKAIKYLQENGH